MLIQIADDSTNMRETIKSVLTSLGATFIESANGEEAVACYAARRPDLVIMDIRMEPMDGIAATRAILECSPDARVIIVTQYDDTDLHAASMKAGALGYILKDDLADLLLAVNHMKSS